MSDKLTIVDLPEILLEMILSFLSYDEIAKNRIVCRSFNEKCKQLLNKGSKLMTKSCTDYLNSVKAQLPRRQSEKVEHPLLSTCYVLESIRTSLLNLSFIYDSYIKENLCCFIPGKIIDESLKIIRLLKVHDKKGKPITLSHVQDLLKEFYDIKGLAIDHFEENVKPIFDRSLHRRSNVLRLNSTLFPYKSTNGTKDNFNTRHRSFKTSDISDKMQGYVEKIEYQESKMREYVDTIEKQALMMKEYAKKIQNQDLKMQMYAERMQDQDSKMQEYTGKIRSQDLKMQEYSRKIQNQDAQLAKVTKNMADLNQKVRNIGFGLIQDQKERCENLRCCDD